MVIAARVLVGTIASTVVTAIIATTILLAAVIAAVRAIPGTTVVAVGRTIGSRRLLLLLLGLLLALLDLRERTIANIRSMVGREGRLKLLLIFGDFLMGLGILLLPGLQDAKEGSFVELKLRWQGKPPAEQTSFEIAQNLDSTTEPFVGRHLEGLLAVLEHADRCIAEPWSGSNLLEVTLQRESPVLHRDLFAISEFATELVTNLLPDGGTSSLDTLRHQLHQE
jgi:hypothetical protein